MTKFFSKIIFNKLFVNKINFPPSPNLPCKTAIPTTHFLIFEGNIVPDSRPPERHEDHEYRGQRPAPQPTLLPGRNNNKHRVSTNYRHAAKKRRVKYRQWELCGNYGKILSIGIPDPRDF